jgi:hypothetical protein
MQNIVIHHIRIDVSGFLHRSPEMFTFAGKQTGKSALESGCRNAPEILAEQVGGFESGYVAGL